MLTHMLSHFSLFWNNRLIPICSVVTSFWHALIVCREVFLLLTLFSYSPFVWDLTLIRECRSFLSGVSSAGRPHEGSVQESFLPPQRSLCCFSELFVNMATCIQSKVSWTDSPTPLWSGSSLTFVFIALVQMNFNSISWSFSFLCALLWEDPWQGGLRAAPAPSDIPGCPW